MNPILSGCLGNHVATRCSQDESQMETEKGWMSWVSPCALPPIHLSSSSSLTSTHTYCTCCSLRQACAITCTKKADCYIFSFVKCSHQYFLYFSLCIFFSDHRTYSLHTELKDGRRAPSPHKPTFNLAITDPQACSYGLKGPVCSLSCITLLKGDFQVSLISSVN